MRLVGCYCWKDIFMQDAGAERIRYDARDDVSAVRYEAASELSSWFFAVRRVRGRAALISRSGSVPVPVPGSDISWCTVIPATLKHMVGLG